MPPKPKFDREEIIDAAFELARREGIDAVKAREVGELLGCSSRPIFTFFDSIDRLKEEVTEKAWSFFWSRIDKASDYLPSFKKRGLLFIEFAKEEPKLFQLLFMTEKEQLDLKALIRNRSAGFEDDIAVIRRDYVTTEEEAERLFAHLWIYSYGICVLCATGICTFTEEELSEMLGECFIGAVMEINREPDGGLAKLSPVKKTGTSSAFSSPAPIFRLLGRDDPDTDDADEETPEAKNR